MMQEEIYNTCDVFFPKMFSLNLMPLDPAPHLQKTQGIEDQSEQHCRETRQIWKNKTFYRQLTKSLQKKRKERARKEENKREKEREIKEL